MAEYIKRDAVLNTIHRFRGYIDEDMEWRMKFAINKIQSADVQPVVHGEWVDGGVDGVGACGIEYRYNKCSVCGYEYSFPMKYNFCPRCGARMDLDGGT